MLRIIFILILAICFSVSTSRAAVTVEPWVPVYQGIEYATGFADTNEVRLQRAFAFRIDLHDPSIEMFSTPGGGSKETLGQTTTTFVSSYGLKVGVNANFFSPVSTLPNEERDLSGLALSRGVVVSPVETIRPMVLITSNNVPSIVAGTFSFSPTNYWTGVAGSDRVLINGIVQTFSDGDFTTGNHPRTAVGISQNGRYLVMLVIDGRQPAWSIGAPLTDVGSWLVRFGCYQGLNLDGGGSTAMAKAQNDGAVLMNKPSAGVQRVNGNHIGAFSQDIAPVFVTPPQNTTVLTGESLTLSSLVGGSSPLRYQWKFSGSNITGATNSSLTLSNVSVANAGNYTLSVSNHIGAVSASASVAVHYRMFANTSFGGNVSKSPNALGHAPNSQVTLTAIPDPGFVFSGWAGDIESSNNPLSFPITADTTVTATFSGFPAEIIVDNPAATFSNTWSLASSASGKYGVDYRIAAASSTRTATFRPTIQTPGRYAVYAWHPIGSLRATNAPWMTVGEGASHFTRVDQNVNGGQWNLISPGLNFLSGTNGYVFLRNTNSGPVVADAVKFVFGYAPAIVEHPQATEVVTGSPVSFVVESMGSGPLAFQWLQDGIPVVGATNSSLTISNTTSAHAGLYSALVTNLYGAATSNPAQLIVNVPPAISSQPSDQTVDQASDVTFSVAAIGTAPFHYLWFFNGNALANATGSSLTVTNVQTVHAGVYHVRVTNIAGVIVSSNATLTVGATPVGPTIVTHPLSQTAIAGRPMVLSARANGTLPLSYQWRFGGNDLAGATSSTLVVPNVQTTNAGIYSVRVMNQVGVTNSFGANLSVHFTLGTVATLGGTLSVSPQQSSYAPGTAISLSAVPDSNFTFTGWTGSAGSTNNPLVLTINSNSTVTANFAGNVNDIIMDNPAAIFSGDWTIGTTANGRFGSDYHFANTSTSNSTSSATYTPDIATPGWYQVYVWYPQGSNRSSNAPWEVVSENQTQLTLVNQMSGGGGWRIISEAHHFSRGTNGFVRLGNNANNSVVIADAVRWSFIYPPSIVAGPANQTVAVGASVEFSVEVAGAGPLTYQWFMNQVPIAGATGASYGIATSQLSDSGDYTVTVSNIGGMVSSSAATLSVAPSGLRFDSITILTNGLQFNMSSEIDVGFAIESSTNLIDWETVTQFTNRVRNAQFIEQIDSSEKRFYRARVSN